MSNLQINTRVRRLFYYLDDFEKGLIRIPLFQRDSVWNDKKKLDLFDSIRRGYPIGSILFWRPEKIDEILSSDYEIKSIGSYIMNERANDFFYILDGFQRLSTLFGCLINPETTKLERDDDEWFKNFNIVYNLENEKFEVNKRRDIKSLDVYKVPLYKLVDNKEFYNFQSKLYSLNLPSDVIYKYLKNYEDVAFKFTDYHIPSTDLVGGNFEESIEIFNRVNSAGTKVSDEWKLSAIKSSNNFRLGSLINETLVKVNELQFYDNNDRKKTESLRELIFRCVQSSFGNLYLDNQKTNINSLGREVDFERNVLRTLNIGVIKSVQFLISELGVLNFDLLPANMQFIFLVEFFNYNETPNLEKKKQLKNWFWQTSYSNYFTIYNPAKRKKAFEVFQSFSKGNVQDPLFNDKPNQKFVVPELPQKITVGAVRSKAYLLFMLNYANEFKEFDINNENSFRQEKLFKEYDLPENIITKYEYLDLVSDYRNDGQLIFKDLTSKPKKQFDLSRLLQSSQNFENYFVTKKMKDLYLIDKNNKEKILILRKNLIIDAEEEFVKKLNIIDYN